MRILVDIAHPANVHYFRHFINRMLAEGNRVRITARNKDVTFQLLNSFRLEFYDMGKGHFGNSIFGKIMYVIWADILMLKHFLQFRPQIAVSFASSYVAHNCFFFRVPHITFEDTEHAYMNMILYKAFSDIIITPDSFYKNLGRNHYRMKALMELFYLHKNVFTPDTNVVEKYGISINKPFVFIRFVSWEAFHDIGHTGLSLKEKIKLVELLQSKCEVYISSEGQIPKELKQYELNINVADIHHILAFAELYLGEGGTMASEAAVLGTPSIYINSLPMMGYLSAAEKNGLLYHLLDFHSIQEKAIGILTEKNKLLFKEKSENFLKDKIDPNELLYKLVINFPDAMKQLFQ